MDDDKVYICCSRVDDPPIHLVEGSTKEVCSVCQSEVWISPATKQTKEERQGIILCIPCAVKKAEASKEVNTIEISEGQKAEIASEVHGDIHDTFKKAFDFFNEIP